MTLAWWIRENTDELEGESYQADIKACQLEACAYAKAIFANHDILADIVRYRALEMTNSWLKKSQKQRTSLLLQAWPGMNKTQCMDAKVWGRNCVLDTAQEPKLKRSSETPTTTGYLWPHINLEDLRRDDLLLVLLQSRANYPPHVFVHNDLESARFGCFADNLEIEEPLCGLTMMLVGQVRQLAYGKLHAWKTNPRARDWMADGIGHPSNFGLIVLQIQDRLLSFLVKCCQLLLGKSAMDRALNTKTLSSDTIPPLAVEITPQQTTFGSLSAKAPYQAPGVQDFTLLSEVVHTRYAEAKDQILALREDHLYLLQHLGVVSEHRARTELHGDGVFRSLVPSRDSPVDCLFQTVLDIWDNLFVWDDLKRQLHHIIHLQNRLNSPFRSSKTSPEEYSEALRRWESDIRLATRRIGRNLAWDYISSPTMCNSWTVVPDDDGTSSLTFLGPDTLETELIGYLQTAPPENLLPPTVIGRILEELLELDKAGPGKISPFVATSMNETILFGQIWSQMLLLQPWIARLDYTKSRKECFWPVPSGREEDCKDSRDSDFYNQDPNCRKLRNAGDWDWGFKKLRQNTCFKSRTELALDSLQEVCSSLDDRPNHASGKLVKEAKVRAEELWKIIDEGVQSVFYPRDPGVGQLYHSTVESFRKVCSCAGTDGNSDDSSNYVSIAVENVNSRTEITIKTLFSPESATQAAAQARPLLLEAGSASKPVNVNRNGASPVSLKPRPRNKNVEPEQDVVEILRELELRTESTLGAEEATPMAKEKLKKRDQSSEGNVAGPIAESATSPSPSPQASSSSTSIDEITAPPGPFVVSKRAFKAFTSIFPSPAADLDASPRSELPWSEFCHAMRSIGFHGESQCGSAWQFRPTETSLLPGGCIVFHEPHPHHCLTLPQARRNGRRLTRNYGLVGEMFMRK